MLEFFHADPAEYTVIFTQNASGALKLVGEAYPFGQGGHYLLTFDNHNSVNGIREFAHAKGAEVTYIPVALPDMRVRRAPAAGAVAGNGRGRQATTCSPTRPSPTSPRCSIRWNGSSRPTRQGWDVLLDAAAFAPTNRLDLSRYKPDFVPLSFYKMFGYPTGIGALLARREALEKLHRPWFAGGTITVASVQGDKYYLAEGPAAFEDGTLDYLNIPAVEIGLRHLAVHRLRDHPRAGALPDRLAAGQPDGAEALQRRCRWCACTDRLSMEKRGGAVTANFFDQDGQAIDHRSIEARGQQGQHLPADRLLLQPRRGRDRPGHLQAGTGGLLHPARARPAPDPGRLPPVHRRQVIAARCASRWGW